MSMSNAELQAEIERLKAANAELAAKSQREIRLKVSDKGALSFYGLQRFPVTLYSEQWNTLLDHADEIRAFMKANEKSLKTKG